MTTVVEPVDVRRDDVSRARAFPVIDVAGVAWPLYKVQAMIVAAVVAVLTLAVSGSGQVTMWAAGAALLGVWWVQRYRTGAAATDPAL